LYLTAKTKGESVYEQPSLHLELARLRHKDYEVEANRARLAAQVERRPSEGLAVVKAAISGLRSALSRRPAPAAVSRLQPAG
jgi:hypothetical protein